MRKWAKKALLPVKTLFSLSPFMPLENTKKKVFQGVLEVLTSKPFVVVYAAEYKGFIWNFNLCM